MKKKLIAVLVQKKITKEFLAAFFGRTKSFRPDYHDSAAGLLEALTEKSLSAIMIEDSLLPLISGKTGNIPVIALLSSKNGLNTAISCRADLYIRSPFIEEDLDYQLKALVMKNEQADEMNREIRDLKTISELTQLITSTLDPKVLLYRIVKKIAEIMPVTRCSIIRIDWVNKFAYVVASFESPNLNTIKLSLKKYPEIIEALMKKKPVFIKDISTDPIMQSVREIVSPLGIRSILVMPIIFEEKVIGTLFLRTSRKNHSFSVNEIKLLRTISDASANTLYNAFLFAQIEDEKTRLEKLAITDYLTGIYNIRYFYHRIVEEFSRSERYALPISCLMLDIDYFKKINDTYGHKTGDLVLKEFALQLKRLSRKSDVLARYGGEEFIIMLPHTSQEGAVAEAERIRNAIREHSFKSLENGVGITVSIGISSCPNQRIKSHDELISAADDALYTAKNNGRDRVVVFS